MRHEREGPVKMEAEVGTSDASTSPGHHMLLATTSGEEGGTEVLPQSSRGPNPATVLVSDFWSPDCERIRPSGLACLLHQH